MQCTSCEHYETSINSDRKEDPFLNHHYTLNGKLSKVIEDIVVKDRFGNDIKVKELWKERTVIVKVLRRLGCCLCRQEAKMLSEMQPLFEKHNVGLVAITHEDVDSSVFITSGYWNWDIYMDYERKVYKAAGLHKVSLSYIFYVLRKRILKSLVGFLRDKGIPNTIQKGSIRQLGGTFVINPRGEIIYSFKAKKFGQFPSIKEIYGLIGGDPDEIHDDTPEEYVYTRERLNEEESFSSSSRLSSRTF
ncbi:hypothetical protein K502DRAFT_356061 [Neoconidiobolus thromboides FSU 785]|nr:hypothetical protein K502DRAFT_356061 [Neoconidiobolus thromboides FSU 785]